ncbi:hypothetical protein BS78_10G039500 [Paspalum vaginatum]|nr:hypothetical protein BS78_10G039500 [Paspalum vaginatum]
MAGDRGRGRRRAHPQLRPRRLYRGDELSAQDPSIHICEKVSHRRIGITRTGSSGCMIGSVLVFGASYDAQFCPRIYPLYIVLRILYLSTRLERVETQEKFQPRSVVGLACTKNTTTS